MLDETKRKIFPYEYFLVSVLISLADFVGADICYVEFNSRSNEVGVISQFFSLYLRNFGPFFIRFLTQEQIIFEVFSC